MAFGAGSEVAHTAIRSVMGGPSSSHAAPQEAAPAYSAPPAQQQSSSQGQGMCAYPQQELMKCLQEQSGNAGACDFYFNALKSCQDSAQQSQRF
jgi:hypothetical protein